MRKKSLTDEPLFDYNSLLTETVDEISRRQGFESDSLSSCKPMSTGLLMLDLLYGGGIRPAWYTHFGPEQSAKTTGALAIVASALKQKIPLIMLCDYEGSSGNSKPYIGNILRTMGCSQSIDEVFGVRDEDTGKWTVPPVVRYRAETRGEAFFDWLSEIERQLPDKKKIGKQWWLRFDKTKANQAKVGDYADSAMAKKYGDGLWVKAQDGNLQGIIVVDSYPAMNPTSADNEDGDNSIALQARMFSKQLPRVKGRLADKMLAVVGINQLRMAPMVRYGNPETEPGGVALKFNCFGENMLLHTEYGLLTAKEYHAMEKHRYLGSIKGNSKIGGWKCVGFSDTIKIITQHGYNITGKPGHKVLTTLCKEKSFPSVQWKTLKQLQNCTNTSSGAFGNYLAISLNEVEDTCEYQTVEYDYVGTTIQSIQVQEKHLSLICDEYLGELLGWIVSEGYTGTYNISITNYNKDNLQRIKYLCNYLKLDCTLGSESITINGSLFAQWVSSIGLAVLSQYKNIPLIIRMSPRSVKLAFLKGLFGGDGWVSRKEIHYSSISNVLLQQLHILLQGLGIFCKYSPCKQDNRERRVSLVSEFKQIPIKKLLDLSKPCMTTKGIKKAFCAGSVYISGKYVNKLKYLLELPIDSTNSKNTWYDDVLPELFTNNKRRSCPKVYQWFKKNIQKHRNYWRISDFYDGWYDDYISYANSLRTSHERGKWVRIGDTIHTLVRITKQYNLVWLKITNIQEDTYQPCYDANVPDTHTIITNGIVSHNSDCRTRFNPRATGMPGWPKNWDSETKNEVEPSVEVAGGKDSYRYIEIRTKKNKLWTPNRKGWLRIWVQDGRGEARGFDPFFDTACYLMYTGQLYGRGRKSLYLKVDKYIPEPVSIKWEQLKKWVLGNKEEMKAVCTSLKLAKPFDLRKLCFLQIEKGVGEKLYVENSSGKAVDEEEEDE